MSPLNSLGAKATAGASLKIVIASDGKSATFITTSGTFKKGKEQLEQLFKELGLEGMNVMIESEFEEHVHGPDEAPHLHAKTGATA